MDAIGRILGATDLLSPADKPIHRPGPVMMYTVALAQVALCGFVDWITGYELTVYPVYAVPILYVVRYGGRTPAVIVSLVCSAVWWWADWGAGHVYSNGWFEAWDVVVRLMFFLIIAFAAISYKQNRDELGARMRLLERSRQLEHEIISISESERERIGRDLHDGVCQYLAAIGFTADLLQQNLAQDQHARASEAGEIARLLQDAVDRAREVARGLSPVDRDEGGLESALEELAGSTTRLTGASCDFLCPEPLPVPDSIRAIHLFRIAQEAVGNAVRHGRARNVIIALEAGDGDLSLRVSDDGTGFERGLVSGGMGLNIMRYRAHAVGGTLDIYPNSPSGTVVSCSVREGATLSSSEGSAPSMNTNESREVQFAYAHRH